MYISKVVNISDVSKTDTILSDKYFTGLCITLVTNIKLLCMST